MFSGQDFKIYSGFKNTFDEPTCQNSQLAFSNALIEKRKPHIVGKLNVNPFLASLLTSSVDTAMNYLVKRNHEKSIPNVFRIDILFKSIAHRHLVWRKSNPFAGLSLSC